MKLMQTTSTIKIYGSVLISLIVVAFVFANQYGFAHNGPITYIPDSIDDKSHITDIILDTTTGNMAPILILSLNRDETKFNHHAAVTFFVLERPYHGYIETDSIGGVLWKKAQYSDRVLVCDSIIVPILFDFEINPSPKVFSSISYSPENPVDFPEHVKFIDMIDANDTIAISESIYVEYFRSPIQNGFTALEYAIIHSKAAIVQYMLNHGTDLDIYKPYGYKIDQLVDLAKSNFMSKVQVCDNAEEKKTIYDEFMETCNIIKSHTNDKTLINHINQVISTAKDQE